MIRTQTIDLGPMMELRVENSVETQGDIEEPEKQIEQWAEDRNDVLLMKTPKRLSKQIVWTRMI